MTDPDSASEQDQGLPTGAVTEEGADRATPDPTPEAPAVEAEKHAADLTSEDTQADPQTRLSPSAPQAGTLAEENAETSLDQPSESSS